MEELAIIVSLKEAILADIPGVTRIIDTKKVTPDDQYFLGNAAVVRGGSLVGWHVADSTQVIRQILKKKGSLMQGYGPRGQHAELGPGLYVSAVPHMWVNRARSKWDFLKDISDADLDKLTKALEKKIREQRESKYISQGEMESALRSLENAKKMHFTEGLISLAGQPYNIRFWKESFLQPLGIKAARGPIEVELHLKGKFAGIEGGHAPRQTLRLLRKGGVDGAFIANSFVSDPQLVVWNPRSVIKIGNEQNIAESMMYGYFKLLKSKANKLLR